MLDGPVEQIIDSTPMLGAAATQDTVRLVRHGVRKLLDAVAAVDCDGVGRTGSARFEFDYQRPARSPTAGGASGPSASGCSPGSPQDAERALRAVEQADGLLDDERGRDAHALLRELIGQDFDIDDDGVPRLHRGTRAGSDRLGGRPGDASRPKEPEPAL